MSLTTQQIAELVAGELLGPGDVAIASMEALHRAAADQLTFITDDRYARSLETTRAAAVLVPRSLDLQPGPGKALIRVADVDLAVARVLEALAPAPCLPDPGVHPSAVIEPTATVDPTARIGAHAYIGRRTVIGPGVVVHPNVSILDDCSVGPQTVIYPGTVIRERCSVGAACILHPNVSIGADGFGYRPAPDGRGLVKIPQIGTVKIGDGVEIGSGTCIDRAKFGATEIGDATKIDNLCQIAHNCIIGRCVVIAGCTGLAGSVTVGDGVMIGGGANLKDHITVGPGARIAGASSVMNDIPASETWGGYPAKDVRIAAREYASMAHLPDLVKQMKKAGRATGQKPEAKGQQRPTSDMPNDK